MLRHNKQGFALLLILAIASLCALSIGILCTQNYITHLHIRHRVADEQARQWAIFALNSAIARLQEFAGKDNTISIKASNFDDELNLSDQAKQNIIGCWETVKDENEYSPKFLGWLNSQYYSSHFESIKSLNNPDDVCLAQYYQYEMRVPKRLIRFEGTENEIKWAFIIEDESQKIDLSLIESPSSTSDKTLNTIYPQRPHTESVATFSAYKPNLSAYQYIDFLEQFYLIDNTLGNQIINNQNLCTVHSYGICSKHSGLKQELNYFLNNSHFSNTDTIFQAPANCMISPPTWKMLQSFIQQAQYISSNSVKIQPFVPFCRPQYLQDYSSITTDIQPPVQHGIYPIITQLLFNIIAATNNNHLTVKICPHYVLWNPYNIKLQLADYQLTTNIFPQQNSDQIGITIIGYSKDNNAPILTQYIPLSANEINYYLQQFWGTIFDASFQPGEVKIFSLQNDHYVTDTLLTRAIPGSYENCFIIETNINVSDYSNFVLLLTDQNGIQNRNWNSWYIRLISSNNICQEIAQVSHNQNVPELKGIFSPAENEKILFSFSAYLKTVFLQDLQDDTNLHWLNFANPRAPIINRTLYQDPTSAFFGQNFIFGNWSWHAIYQLNSASLNTEQLNFLNQLILFELPYMPNGVENIITLRHVNWTPFGYLPAYSFGNSNANPYIPSNTTFVHHDSTGTWPTHANVEALHDYTYLLNEALFDNFFCIPLNNFHNSVVYQRIKHISPEQDISAENTLIKGAFNIHTNEIEPWVAYLSTIRSDDNYIIFPRLSNNEQKNIIYSKFSQNHIKILAKNIINLVKQRHYFPTLSAFINRQLNATNQYHGLLQRAINDSELNKSVQKNYLIFSKNKSWFDDNAANCYLEDGLPNVVNQADVLQTIANFISVRSDTFKITAYGEYTYNGHTVTKKCEAIVQRFPEYVNSLENKPYDNELSYINQSFGRRFKIILFRWCN